MFWSVGDFQLVSTQRVNDAPVQFGIQADFPQDTLDMLTTITARVDTSRNNGTVLRCQVEGSILAGIIGTDAVNITTYG